MKIKKDAKKTREHIKKYIDNKEIKTELNNIKKRSKSIKIKLSINLLKIKNVFILKMFVDLLSFIRIIYRKIRLG